MHISDSRDRKVTIRKPKAADFDKKFKSLEQQRRIYDELSKTPESEIHAWALNHFHDIWNIDRQIDITPHLFFISLKIRVTGYAWRHSAAEAVARIEFKGFYLKACQEMFGRLYVEKRLMQPLTFAFLDFDGSRTSGTMPTYGLTGPHVHAIMLVHPDGLYQFEKFIGSAGDVMPHAKRWPNVESIQVKPYDRNRSRLSRLASYCAKYGTKSSTDDWWILPE